MRQKLFTVWTIILIIFVLYSCSSELNNTLKNEIERNSELKLNEDSIKTRSGPWDETPLEWAESMNGTCEHSAGMNYLYVGDYPEYKNTDKYKYGVFLDWGAGEVLSSSELAEGYLLQVQWKWWNSSDGWEYIKMFDNEYGLVKIISSGIHEDIPACAFPFGEDKCIELRIRLVKKDFLESSPASGADREDKYDRSLFSSWWNKANCLYYNYWGYGKSNNGEIAKERDEDELGESEFMVIVYLPEDTYKYKYSYEVYNLNADNIQSCRSKDNSHKTLITTSKSKGTIEVIAMRYNKITERLERTSVSKDYSEREKSVAVFIDEGSFGLD